MTTYSRRQLILQSEAITSYNIAIHGGGGSSGSDKPSTPGTERIKHRASGKDIAVGNTPEAKEALLQSNLTRLMGAQMDVEKMVGTAGGLKSAAAAQTQRLGNTPKTKNAPVDPKLAAQLATLRKPKDED